MNFNHAIKLALAALLNLVLTIGLASAHLQLLQVKVGDILSVHVVGHITVDAKTGNPTPDPKFEVLSDGTIQSHDFGILKVAGLTVLEVTKRVRDRLAAKYNSPVVSVILETEAPSIVYLSGTKSSAGPVHIVPGMDLRQLLSSAELPENADQFDVHFFRAGMAEQKATVQAVLSGTTPLANLRVQQNDVVAIMPVEFVRVWVTGDVEHPGQVTLQKGDDLYRAVASAGGVVETARIDNDSKIALRRGPNTTYYPIKDRGVGNRIPLESGDTIAVISVDQITVTVTGEVKTPGKELLRSDAVLDQAVAQAGGISLAGTGREVTILRDGKEVIADVASSTSDRGFGSFHLMDHDVILVRQNTRFAIAVGYVKVQGRVYIPDGQPMHLIDVVMGAGGIVDSGTPRHVLVGHPDKNGIMRIREVRLDRYLKGGDAAGNPSIVPGDIVTVQQAQVPAFQVLQETLSGAVLLYGVSHI